MTRIETGLPGDPEFQAVFARLQASRLTVFDNALKAAAARLGRHLVHAEVASELLDRVDQLSQDAEERATLEREVRKNVASLLEVGGTAGTLLHNAMARLVTVGGRVVFEKSLAVVAAELAEAQGVDDSLLDMRLADFVRANAAAVAERVAIAHDPNASQALVDEITADLAASRLENWVDVGPHTPLRDLKVDAVYVRSHEIAVLDWHPRPNPRHAAKTELYKVIIARLAPPRSIVYGRDIHYELLARLPPPPRHGPPDG